ncbi:hypothetical protein COT94_00010 [Candidatus Falkowbacteria bacterium CG10_big_fil_rev_8_21_14_0_10_37_14]|uniref:Uncharacterized protein n=1 Tax=Candidatus Falkowbacteria bacterium CG10_big_fil_rev_8_21_14_0_10_37_14 TaxID=1974561 RepID=A0A2M6WUP3_9BACT|nr:hypothetical protein [Candidatus Falkowbacteria bacterium]PIT96500.1 MAG: hypothetical protein COT94_00010 [Candidatus Falkowbacteria bacterium CG10_big_fil_rev_8_21_14_0_10_37_14]
MSREFNPQYCIENREELRNLLSQAFIPKLGNPSQDDKAIKLWWTNFYKKYFGSSVDLSNVKIPDHQEGFDRVLIVAKDLKITQVLHVLKSHMKVWLYKNDLCDKDVPVNDRDSKKDSYAVRFRNRIEADEELKNRSVKDLKDDKISGITLLERLLMELAYFEETGKHLDIDNITLCSGSRYSNGHVPNVHWHDDELSVNLCFLGYSFDDLRSRAVVS